MKILEDLAAAFVRGVRRGRGGTVLVETAISGAPMRTVLRNRQIVIVIDGHEQGPFAIDVAEGLGRLLTESAERARRML